MLFNSYIFMLLFLPIALIGYFALSGYNTRAANLFLAGMSLWFYGYDNPRYLILILLSIAVNFSLTRGMRACRRAHGGENGPVSRSLLGVGVLFNVGMIFYFKFFDFVLSNENAVTGASFNLLHLALPLGISFYTFQQISYVVDSYRGETDDYSFPEYALFVTYFPQLIAGPIVLHREMIPQFRDPEKRRIQYDNLASGMMMFTCGLAKKVLIADYLSSFVSFGFSRVALMTTTDTWIVMLSYTFQLYFDFSGYCDMATGIARMFNFTLPINFDSPYQSLSDTEFWRRWHVTLGRFLREYVYFPLGGSRKGQVRTYLNLMIVFLASGIWHGANWTFILWGLLHGCLNCIDRLIRPQYEKLAKWLRWCIFFLITNVLWLLFRSESVSQWLRLVRKAFTPNGFYVSPDFMEILKIPGLKTALSGLHIPYSDPVLCALSVFLIFAGCLFVVLRLPNNYRREYRFTWRSLVVTLALLIYCILSLGKVSVFLYFNF